MRNIDVFSMASINRVREGSSPSQDRRDASYAPAARPAAFLEDLARDGTGFRRLCAMVSAAAASADVFLSRDRFLAKKFLAVPRGSVFPAISKVHLGGVPCLTVSIC